MSRVLIGGAFVFALAWFAFPSEVRAEQLIRDAEIEHLLEDFSEPVFRAAQLNPEEFGFVIIRSPQINAFVTGNNHILLNTGLILAAESYPVLLAVIAHEIAHIASGHLVRRLEQYQQAQGPVALLSTFALIAVGAASGDPGAAIGGMAAAQQIADRSFLQYTRNEELSADSLAIDYLEQVGTDPSAMLDLIDILKRKERLHGEQDPYALTHPLADNRLRNLRPRVLESQFLEVPLNPQLAYRYARARAKVSAFVAPPGSTRNSRLPSGGTEPELLAHAIERHLSADLKAALKAVDQLIALRPEDPYYCELKGQILFESGLPTESVAPYRRAVRLSEGETLLAAGLGQALLSLDTLEANREAIQVLTGVVREDPLDARSRRLLAIAYARTGDEARAALMSAEERLILADIAGAARFAKRAESLSARNSTTWYRARDILVALGRPVEEE